MSLEENKTLVRRYYDEAWSGGNLAVVDELIAPDAVHPHYRDYPPGPEGFKQAIIGPQRTFPDLRLVIRHLIAEGDLVTTHYVWSGTDLGGFPGASPTGKRVEIPGINIDRVADGKIAAHWTVIDELALRQVLGLIPA